MSGFFPEPESIKTLIDADPSILIPYEVNDKCVECESIDIDVDYQRWFKINVCESCRKTDPYKLITKTKAKEDYLLTDPELRDSELLPCIKKPNPHKSQWSEMSLYLRKQVEAFAFKKWNGMDEIEAEKQNRVEKYENQKQKRFKRKLKELRKKTRPKEPKPLLRHVHTFRIRNGYKYCTNCDLKTEYEEF